MVSLHNDKKISFEDYSKFLLMALKCGGYPHEIICYFFSKALISNINGELVQIWPPRRIVKQLSDTSLYDLCGYLEYTYCVPENTYHYFNFSSDNVLWDKIIIICFRYLYIALDKKVEEISRTKPKDHGAKSRWRRIMSNHAGVTSLSDYFGIDPAHDIENWSSNVVSRIKNLMQGNKNINRTFDELLAEDIPLFKKYCTSRKN
jgi:hypothetical protein